MYLQILFSCIDEKSSDYQRFQEKNFKKIDEYIKELEILTLRYRLVKKDEK